MVNQRMIHDVEGEDTQVEITPSFKLSVVDENRYSAASAVCDLIIKQSDGIIEEASGLYVDGELIGAVKSSADLRYILQNILNAAKEGDTDAEAAFAQNVETVSGLFPTNSIMTTEEMESLLTGTEKDAVLYTVKAGDTATSIAQDHNLTLTELASINQFSDIDVLHEGDLLNIEMAVPKLSVNIMKIRNMTSTFLIKPSHRRTTANIRIIPRSSLQASTAGNTVWTKSLISTALKLNVRT